MDPAKFGTLKDLYGHDLAGWIVAPFYFLEVKNSCMGIFPAIVTKDKYAIFTQKKSDLAIVWGCLSRREAKISARFMVAHLEQGIAFRVEGDEYERDDRKPLRIFSRAVLEELCKNKEAVEWAPGLFGGSGEPFSDPDFTD